MKIRARADPRQAATTMKNIDQKSSQCGQSAVMLALGVSAAVFWGILAFILLATELSILNGIAVSMASSVLAFGAVFGALYILSVLKIRSSISKTRHARRA